MDPLPSQTKGHAPENECIKSPIVAQPFSRNSFLIKIPVDKWLAQIKF
jgi:hypothetical protein